MMPLCAYRDRSSYATGRVAGKNGGVLRPGGLELTARGVTLAGLEAGATVLDLGCGAGDTVRYLRTLGMHAIGIDCETDSEGQEARSPAPYAHIVTSAEELPFPDGSANGVLAECSLSVLQNQNDALAECARVLADGGRLIVTDLYARQPEAIAAVRALKGSCVSGMIVRRELEAMLVRHGLTCDLWEDHSQALRESAARFIFEHDSLAGIWGCGGEHTAETIQIAMRAARAGYFLLIATRTPRSLQKGGWNHER